MNEDQHKRAAGALSEEMSIEPNEDGTFTVKGDYTVDLDARSCSCPDHEYRGHTCKHLVRTNLEVLWENVHQRSSDDDDETVSRPMPLTPSTDSIPEVLRANDHWVCWTYKRDSEESHAKDWTKIPIDVNGGGFASSTDSDTWTDFDDAVAYDTSTRERTDGIGFVVHKDDAFIGIDIDNCRDADSGEIQSPIQDLIKKTNSYTEVSPSGTGIRVFIRGSWPLDKCQTDSIAGSGVELEVYEWGRYLTVTGHHIAGTPTEVTNDTDTIDMYAKIMSPGYSPDE